MDLFRIPFRGSIRFLPLFAAVLLMGLYCGCTSRPVDSTMPATFATPEMPNGGHIIELDNYQETDKLVEKDLKNFSRILQIPELPQKPESDRFEFRLWTNLGGRGDAGLLAVRTDGNNFRSDFVKFGDRDGKLFVEKTDLGEPQMGRQAIAFAFTTRLTTPHGIKRDPDFALHRDESIILLEVIQWGEYRRIFYGRTTTFPDGLKLKEVCSFLAAEFNIDMECDSRNGHS